MLATALADWIYLYDEFVLELVFQSIAHSPLSFPFLKWFFCYLLYLLNYYLNENVKSIVHRGFIKLVDL